MIRERTSLNLLIGLFCSLLAHASLVLWGPAFSLQLPALQPASEVEVHLRDWPTPPPPAPTEAVQSAEPAPAEPPPAPAAKPSSPPDESVLREAVAAAVRAEPPRLQAPDRLPLLPTFEPHLAPVHLPPALRDSLQPELRLPDPPPLPSLPQPERVAIEPLPLPALPGLERHARRDVPASRPANIALPTSGVASIQGPAAERQVIFQPSPPSVTVESESELELRFWILPNGAVGRVVPVKKADPRLEALAINYLRHWRFNPLPAGAPQEEQWGIIPFKFRIR